MADFLVSKHNLDDFRLTETEIDNLLSVREGINLLRRLGLTDIGISNITDIKTLLRLHCNSNNNENNNDIAETPLSQTLKDALQEYNTWRTELMDMYYDAIQFVNDSSISDQLEEIEQHFGPDIQEDFKEELQKVFDNLQHMEQTILVAGEISSGKTSLVNLLLGKHILPVRPNQCTNILCTIRNGSEEKVIFTPRKPLANEEPVQPLEFGLKVDHQPPDPNENCWLDLVTGKTMSNTKKYDIADFRCNLPFLQDQVVIIDSPGVTRFFINEALKRCIKNCIGFIFVIKTDNYGGINSALKDLMNEILKTVGSDSCVFIFNRWDQVLEDYPTNKEQIEKIRKDCIQQLKSLWPLVDENKQVFFMSIKKISEMLNQVRRAKPPEDLLNLQTAIKKMIPKALKSSLIGYYEKLKFIIEKYEELTITTINNSMLTQENRIFKMTEVEQILQRLFTKKDDIANNLTTRITKITQDVVTQVLYHLKHNDDAMKRMCTFKAEQLPTGDKFEVIGLMAQQVIRQQIDTEIKEWNKQPLANGERFTHMQRMLTNVEDTCLMALKEVGVEIGIINQIFGADDAQIILGGQHGDFDITQEETNQMFSKFEKVLITATSPVWFPLAISAGVLVLPIVALLTLSDNMRSNEELQKYINNRAAYMQRWLENHIVDGLNETEVHEVYLHKEFTEVAWKTERVIKYIPKVIETYKNLIEKLSNDSRDNAQIRKFYRPIGDQTRGLLNKIYNFNLCHLFKYKYTTTDFENKDLGLFSDQKKQGSFGIVCAANCLALNRKMALKYICKPLGDTNAYDIFKEYKNWKILCITYHENILKLHGLMLIEGELGKNIAFVSDLCDHDLSDVLKLHSSRLPAKQKSTEGKRKGFEFTVSHALQIANGLHFIHSKGFVHRDLKPGNVLANKVNKDSPQNEMQYHLKLCDFGVTKHQAKVNMTLCGTLAYISPEIMNENSCSQKSDIYSLGFILWEMYHGTAVIDNIKFANEWDLKDIIRSQQIDIVFPDLQIPDKYKQLIIDCTLFAYARRPKVDYCYANLKALLADFDKLFPNLSNEM